MHCKFHIRERAFQFLLEPISGLTNTLDIDLVFTTNGIIWNQKQLKLFQHLKKEINTHVCEWGEPKWCYCYCKY